MGRLGLGEEGGDGREGFGGSKGGDAGFGEDRAVGLREREDELGPPRFDRPDQWLRHGPASPFRSRWLAQVPKRGNGGAYELSEMFGDGRRFARARRQDGADVAQPL